MRFETDEFSMKLGKKNAFVAIEYEVVDCGFAETSLLRLWSTEITSMKVWLEESDTGEADQVPSYTFETIPLYLKKLIWDALNQRHFDRTAA